MSTTNKAYFFVVLTALLFSTMEVACKVARNELDPFQLTFLRFLIGGLVLLPFAVKEMRSNEVKLTMKDLAALTGVGIIGIPISMVFFQIGIINSNASTASVLFSINPLFTMIAAHFLTAEKMNRHKAIVLLIGISGLVFIIKPWNMQEGNTMYGAVMLLLAALVFGFYTVTGKICSQKVGAIAQASISFLLGSLVLLVVIIVMGRPVVADVPEHWAIVLYTGIFVTGLGYFAYFTAIKLSDASTGSFAFFLKPAIAPVIAVIFLRETILWNTYVGIGLILAASYMNIRYQRKKNEINRNLENEGH